MNSLIFTSSSTNLDEANGNLMGTIVPTNTNEDESSSLSDEKSAPTELLAEFLTSIMKRDYVTALKYCKLILDYESNNKTAKDFYPQLLAKVNEQNSTSSDDNCNFTNSLEFVDNENLDNDNVSLSSSISSNSISSNDESDMNSNSEEGDQRDRDDLLNSLSHSSSQSSDSSKSDQPPQSISSSSSHKQNTSNSFSFTSLLLDESEDTNNNESSAQVDTPHQNPSSPFTTKIMQMFKGKWEAGHHSKQN